MAKKSGLIATVVFAVVLAGTIIYSWIIRPPDTRTLKGFISVVAEPFFKDARVQQILADNHFRVDVARMGSRDMVTTVSKAPDAPQFLMPFGVLAAQMITAEARRQNIITTTYAPFQSPLVVGSWEPVAQILVDNGAAVKSGDRVYDLDLGKIMEFMFQQKRWKDMKQHQRYDVLRSILIATTDPRTSNAGAIYLALVSHALNGYDVVIDRETARQIADKVADLVKRQGYQGKHINEIFDDYISIGMGKTPLAFIYEFQLVAYAIANKSVPVDAVLLYPKPTMFDKQVFVALNEDAKKLGEILSTQPELQKIAVENGFRVTNSTLFKEATRQIGFSVKETVVDVVDSPTEEIMTEMIDIVTKAMD